MKKVIIVLTVLCFGLIAWAQEPSNLTEIKLPIERSNQITEIQKRQDALVRDHNVLEMQKEMIKQRAALELGLKAEQYDQMDLASGPGGYVFKPKEKPTTVKSQSKQE